MTGGKVLSTLQGDKRSNEAKSQDRSRNRRPDQCPARDDWFLARARKGQFRLPTAMRTDGHRADLVSGKIQVPAAVLAFAPQWLGPVHQSALAVNGEEAHFDLRRLPH